MNDGIDPNELTLRQLIQLQLRGEAAQRGEEPAPRHTGRVFYLGQRPPRLLTLDDIRDNLGELIHRVISEVEEPDDTGGGADGR